MTPLHRASENGHLFVAMILRKLQVDVNVEDEVRNIRFLRSCISRLLKVGATPLHLASKDDHVVLASKLIEWGANVNAADKVYIRTHTKSSI